MITGLDLILLILAECLAASFGISFFIVDVLMNPKLYCWRKGHRKFYYVSNSAFPGEHAYWCGNCSYESSDEADERKRKEKIEERKTLYQHTVWEGMMRRGYW